MGQNLTHGIYLPDEGERNCYDGLAGNWQLLDGAVGTIAEHTTQIAGKAALVHTHTKSDITDFPVYGTTAGTICEGNDSRLSDARTPVAHTHTKSDVTDLFNSANTWSGINSFSNSQIFQAGAYFYNSDSTAATSTLNLRNSKVTKGGTSDNGSQIIQFLDKDNKFLSQITTVKALSGTTQLQFTLGNIDGNNNSISGSIQYSLAIDGTKQFIPGSNNTHNLGNSSYQWNNLYAKNYFYNGVAWGLDKANVWSAIQTISYAGSNIAIALKHQETDIAVSPTRNNWHYINFYDKNSVALGGFNYSKRTNGNSRVYLNLRTKNTNNNIVEKNVFFETNQEGTDWNLYSASNADINLGTSTNKWKSFNGINPGALSLPNVDAVTGSSNTQLQDISGDLVQDQYFNCYFTPRMDGWAYIALDCSNATIRSGHSSYTVSVKTARGFANSIYTQSFTKNENAFSNVQIFIPVTANKEITLECSFTGFSVTKGYVIPCLGNV